MARRDAVNHPQPPCPRRKSAAPQPPRLPRSRHRPLRFPWPRADSAGVSGKVARCDAVSHPQSHLLPRSRHRPLRFPWPRADTAGVSEKRLSAEPRAVHGHPVPDAKARPRNRPGYRKADIVPCDFRGLGLIQLVCLKSAQRRAVNHPRHPVPVQAARREAVNRPQLPPAQKRGPATASATARLASSPVTSMASDRYSWCIWKNGSARGGKSSAIAPATTKPTSSPAISMASDRYSWCV